MLLQWEVPDYGVWNKFLAKKGIYEKHAETFDRQSINLFTGITYKSEVVEIN